MRDDAVALVVPSLAYGSLTSVMFHMIRQNAAGSTAVMIRALDVLSSVIECERDEARRKVLLHHADLFWADAQRTLAHGALGSIDARSL